MSACNSPENNEIQQPTTAQETPPERSNYSPNGHIEKSQDEAEQQVTQNEFVNKSVQQSSNAVAMLHAGTMVHIARIAMDGDFALEPRGRGRPAILDERMRRQVCLLLQFGYPRALVAAELGIERSTIRKAMRRDPEFRKQVLTAEELFVRTPTLTLMAAARTNWRAAAWVLEHYKPHASVIRRKNRERERQSDRDNMRRYGTTDPFPSLFAATLPPKQDPTIIKRKKKKA